MGRALTRASWLVLGVAACTPAPAPIPADAATIDAPLPYPDVWFAPFDASVCSSSPDWDGDGHASFACGGDDCNDYDALVSPDAVEVCDPGHDEDCNPLTFGSLDADGDGYDSSGCWNYDGGVAHGGADCDDTRATAYPHAPETCNMVDDDCDRMIDEGLLHAFYPDGDGDGFGVSTGAPVLACSAPAGYVEPGRDCDDARATIHPGAVDGLPENCNGANDDCDASIDEACRCTPPAVADCGALDPTDPTGATFLVRGQCHPGTQTCAGPDWSTTCTGAIFPTAETCGGGRDEDCDGEVDEGCPCAGFPSSTVDVVHAVVSATSGAVPALGLALVWVASHASSGSIPAAADLQLRCATGGQRLDVAHVETTTPTLVAIAPGGFGCVVSITLISADDAQAELEVAIAYCS